MMRNRYLCNLPDQAVTFLSEVYFVFDAPGKVHAHAQTQWIAVFDGTCDLTLDGVTRRLNTGDIAVVPARRPHAVGAASGACRPHLLDLRINVKAGGPIAAFAAAVTWPVVFHVVPDEVRSRSNELAARLGGGALVRVGAIQQAVWALLTLFADAISPPATAPVDDRRVRIGEQFLLASLHRPIGAADVARACGLSVSQTDRLFHAHGGESPVGRLRSIRIRHARELLETTTLSVKEISSQCGFLCPNHFSRVFRAACGVGPQAYAKTARRAPAIQAL